MIWLDFETRSRCDLPSRGVYNYAQDGSTEVLCMSYAFDDGEVATWLPGMPFPDIAGHQIMAHNAAFERLVFWYVLCPTLGIPEPPLTRFTCTAAQARANCLPGSLEDVGRAVSSKMKKDHRGSALIRLLSVPRKDGTFNDDPTLMAEFFAYCEQDVRAMREISKAMRPLSDDELADYHVNERINDRGVLVDVDLCRAAIGYAEAELIEIQEIVREVSKGEITSVRSPKMRQWVQDRVGPEAVKLMWTGEKYSIDKTVRANLLTLSPDEVPPDVAEVIQCADDLWASSVAKFKRLADLADVEDNRVRGAFVFAGGSATGRASSYGAQVHNFTRKVAKDPAAVRQAMVRREFPNSLSVDLYEHEPVAYWGHESESRLVNRQGEVFSANFGEQALVKVTTVFGWPAVPKAIEQATILQAARHFKRYDSPLGVAGFGDFGVVRVSRFLDADVQMLVEPYQRMRIFR